ncbi:MAG: hypothetical protein IJQ67_02520 [Bacilli bacterium]|nr:hypothetical protein [Bacilli bacterium]
MNKGKLSLSLVTSFIAAIAVTACGSKVSSDPKAIVTFTGYDGKEVEVLTDDVYFDYLKKSSGIGKFYDAMLEVLIRYEYGNDQSALWKKEKDPTDSYSRIESTCKSRIKSMKNDAKKDASANGTSYKTEWEKVLEQQGVEDEKELLQKLIYNMEKENVEDWYFRNNETALLKEYIGQGFIDNKDQKVAASYPYHIRHILASISGGSSDFYYATISEAEALKLYTIAKSLRDGKETFGEIAVLDSGDSSSAINSDGTRLNGSVGIMDRTTSFVNEFKLGIYAYDALYSGRAAADTKNAETGLGMYTKFNDAKTNSTVNVRDKLAEIGLSYVPYKVFEQLNEFKEDVKDKNGHQVNDGNSNYYPRNVYWNKYLNRHNVFVITNNDLVDGFDGEVTNTTGFDASIAEAAEGKCGFRYVEGVSMNDDQLILTDEVGRPIVCVRSEHGIHFMIIEKSIYDANLDTYYTADEEVYYNEETKEYNKNTFVGFINTSDSAQYKSRAKDIEAKITGFDSTYDYRLFQELVNAENGKISFKIEGEDKTIDLLNTVENYIKIQQEQNLWNAEKNLNDSWRTYLELLEIQQDNRIEERMIPELCALKYRDAATANEYKEIDPDTGVKGVCYYAK